MFVEARSYGDLSEVDEDQEKLIYAGLVTPEKAPQIQAAVSALLG